MAQTSHGPKVVAAMFALSMALVASITALFLMVTSVFPWMTVVNQREDVGDRAGAKDVVAAADVTSGGPTAAERTLRRVMSEEVSLSVEPGWAEVTASGGVPGVSFGFGCDPTDGLAPVVAEARSWVRSREDVETSVTRAVGTVDVSARAYPAGGGAVAFDGLTDAVLRCEAASLGSAGGLGVEAVQVDAGGSESLVWRRGDVLMVGTVTASDRMTSVSDMVPVFVEFDAALRKALVESCVDPVAGVEDAQRSPYLNRQDFFGNSETVKVERERVPRRRSAEVRTTDEVVPIPSPDVEVPTVTYLPPVPSPPVLSGPTALPSPVPAPVAPISPGAPPATVVDVPRKVDDPQGPGCGWAFTGQTPPRFDAPAARSDFKERVGKAERSMMSAWRDYQEDKIAYFAAYADYVAAAGAYEVYAAEVERVSDAWALIEVARAEYYSLVESYTAAVAAFDQWRVDRAQARVDFGAARQACREREPVEPVEDPKPTKPGKPGSPGDAAEVPDVDEPQMVCPPVRPTILDAEPPVVPDVPVPSKQAQLGEVSEPVGPLKQSEIDAQVVQPVEDGE